MDIISLLQSKPVLIGLHLGFAILGIDLFFWLLGKFKDRTGSVKNRVTIASIGTLAFISSWIAGGYYYVVYYGSLVKPVIKAGVAPWAHNIIMEAKEHIFLFVVPMAVVVLFIAFMNDEEIDRSGIRKMAVWLSGIVAVLGLLIGAMGFIISAAARFGALQ